MISWNEPVDFLARHPQSVELLAPVYRAMDESWRGDFFVPAALVDQAEMLGVKAVGIRGSVNRPLEVIPPRRSSPIVTCTYRDLLVAARVSQRAQIHFQMDGFRGAVQEKVNLFVCDEERRDWVKKNWMKKSCISIQETAAGTAEAIIQYVKERSTLRTVTNIDGESIGIIYMAFGEKAAAAVKASVKSLRRVGLQIPVCVIGSTPVEGLQFIEWTGESPFDPLQKKNFQFRAGRVKPKLYGLTPFERTLYLDADTEFIGDIFPGFEALGEYDVAIARENLTLAQLYNKKLAGWEINLIERDATMKELNTGGNVYFLNSGVLFFRKSFAVEAAMKLWHEEWLRWQQWDEQLAFMRGFFKTPNVKMKILEPQWNAPHRTKGIVIFHNYGRGVVRMDAPLSSPPAAEAASPQMDAENVRQFGESEVEVMA